MHPAPAAAIKPTVAVEAFTLRDWLEWRNALDLPLLVAVHVILKDVETNEVAVAERHCAGASLH